MESRLRAFFDDLTGDSIVNGISSMDVCYSGDQNGQARGTASRFGL